MQILHKMRKKMFVHRAVPENTNKNTSHAENSELLVNIFSRAAKYLKDKKHNGPYSTRKCARIFVFEHYLFHEGHFFPFHQFISFFKFWTLLIENVDIDEKYQ